MQSEASIEIDRSIDEVFTYTNENVAEWSLTVVSDEPVEIKEGHIGSTFHLVTEEHGRKMEFDGVVTEWDPPRTSVVQMTGKSFDLDVRYTFEDLGGRTRVSQQAKVTPKGVWKIFFALFGWMFHKAGCKAGQKEFESLKRHLESRVQPTSGDGS